jgi:dTDP-4-amino-4,6-dideoxygalactose transaminase
MNKYTFKTSKIRNTDLNVIERKMQDFREKVEIQRQNSQYLIQELSNTSLKLPVEAEGTYCNYYLFPIMFENESERDKVSEMLREKGIDTAKLFSKTPEIAKLNYGYMGDCLDTEWVAERILIVPNHYTLGKGELQRISGIIKTFPLSE